MRNRVLTSTLVSLLALGALGPAFGDAKGVPNENAVGYWTQDRRDNAIAREFQFEPGAKVGKLVPQAKRGSSTGGTTTTTGTSYWPANQQSQFVANITGKVFFNMNGTDYVCSGSLVNDDNASIVVVLTAGHCVWDNTKSAWATNWSFFPNYDPDSKLNQVSFKASKLFARKSFTNQNEFNMTAIINDYAFSVIDKNVSSERVNPTGILPSISSFTLPTNAYAFGYPQASPYNGKELVYSFGALSTDTYTNNSTWKLGSNLTGGASGGPWYKSIPDGQNQSFVGSLNSYKYGSDRNNMYGPQFSQSTVDLLIEATKSTCPIISTTITCQVLP